MGGMYEMGIRKGMVGDGGEMFGRGGRGGEVVKENRRVERGGQYKNPKQG